MDELKKLLDITNILMGENGCPWDKKQTFDSLKWSIIEEGYELLDAIEDNDTNHVLEEIGDIFYLAIFLSEIAKKNKLFALEDVIKNISEKLIRRHPHIFENENKAKVKEADVINEWEKIKLTEVNHQKRKSILDGIPRHLPSFMKAKKIISKLKQQNIPCLRERYLSKDEFEKELIFLVFKAINSGFDLEDTLNDQLKLIAIENEI